LAGRQWLHVPYRPRVQGPRIIGPE